MDSRPWDHAAGGGGQGQAKHPGLADNGHARRPVCVSPPVASSCFANAVASAQPNSDIARPAQQRAALWAATPIGKYGHRLNTSVAAAATRR
jgi:hypothetical protein